MLVFTIVFCLFVFSYALSLFCILSDVSCLGEGNHFSLTWHKKLFISPL